MALLPALPLEQQRSASDFSRCSLAYDRVPTMALASELAERLRSAVAFGADAPTLARLLADGADPNSADAASGETSLHRAAARGSPAIVHLLLTAGSNPHALDSLGRTPLFHASHGGHLSAAQTLLVHGAQLFPDVQTPTSAPPASASSCSASAQASSPEVSDDAFLALRTKCPLAAAAAAARWPLVAALLSALPRHFARLPSALRSLRFLVWALASHKAFPRDVIAALPSRLPSCVLDAVRPAHLASTPLVLAAGNDQQLLMNWLLQQGADPELGAPLLLCAGRFCHGSRTCCVNTLLRRGARPHVAWSDSPALLPLHLAAAGDCFTHVHVLCAYGADVEGEAARVRKDLFSPPDWEAHLDELISSNRNLLTTAGCEQLCVCGQDCARRGLWALEAEAEEGSGEAKPAAAGAGGNSCFNRTPADDAWYRIHREQMEQLQDVSELAACRKGVEDLWRYGCSAVEASLGGPAALTAEHCLRPAAVLAAMQDVAGGWLAAAIRCRQQRLLRLDLYDKAVAAGRDLLARKRVAALAALGGAGIRNACGAGEAAAPDRQPQQQEEADGDAEVAGEAQGPAEARERRSVRPTLGGGSGRAAAEGLVAELKIEILALAGLAPPGVEARLVSSAVRAACGCIGCHS
ncbi:hypothetical protein HYH03_017652 [Edaphochlamys debaryana]|uniref:Uncharacterized protein n=1 Tax=Edaphochlamys debaryana TaxID=47281 RepID=A0A835XNS7_9CHLO|nr:hypothetical protein HYH03_017652 [Edaphochlamys debaryana]|eukprot:KAG2483469.1 hypothetical protein HYH03_017652 [Edaphochlamys debaryana]